MHLLLKIVPKTPTQKRAVFLLLLFSLPSMLSSKTRIVNATIDTSKTGAPILKNIYGQFLEHGGDIADRFQNHLLPFFSKNLCFTADCR